MKQERQSPAQTVVNDVCRIKKGERVLIVANPETSGIAQNVFSAAREAGAVPVLLYQEAKIAMDNADPAVIAALKTEPDVFFSISYVKLGKDPEAVANPYRTADGKTFDHIFDYLLDAKKTMRAVWTPGLTEDMFNRTVQIDYALLAQRCEKLIARYKDVVSVHVTAPAGTDVVVPVAGRMPLADNGDFSSPGSGGNIPAGEVFISPVVGKIEGVIVYDGSMTFSDGDAILNDPIRIVLKEGYITDITGKKEAARLLKDITEAEKTSLLLEKSGKLPAGQGAVYKRNARNIGELGIGLNPEARITGNMLEDEKAFQTCHFAVGANYDNDAPSLIHFDGVVRTPTIVFTYADGSSFELMHEGELQL
jgi:aminopeptidase